MFGIDDSIAGLSDGTKVLVVLAIAVLLGLRHAADPDHLAAVTTLVANGRDRSRKAAARLGIAWGLGHATTLFAFGLPIVLFKAYLPEGVQKGVEAAVGLVIVVLAVWLLARWRRGAFRHAHVRTRAHEGARDGRQFHLHKTGEAHHHAHRSATARSPLQAYGIGLVHGMGGSAGVGVLLLASIHNRLVAVLALLLFAAFTAAAMAALTTGVGSALSTNRVRRSFDRLVPALGATSLAFGIWYGLGALDVAPTFF